MLITHFSAVTHAKDCGAPKLLVVRSKIPQSRHTRIKFPGGSSEPGESYLDTALREAVEELAGSQEFRVYSPELILNQEVFGSHHKLLYSIQYEGELRTTPLMEEDGEELSAPYYEDVRVLWYDPNFLLSHRAFLNVAIVHYARKMESFVWAVEQLELVRQRQGAAV